MRDPGLQPERTGLGWQRTALAAWACALLLVHYAAISGWGPRLAPAVLAISTALTLSVVGGRRQHMLRENDTPPVATRRAVAICATLVSATALATLGAVAGLLSR